MGASLSSRMVLLLLQREAEEEEEDVKNWKKGAVGRCKARKRWIKAAAEQRRAMSAAHAAYMAALKKTGAALCHFAHGEEEGELGRGLTIMPLPLRLALPLPPPPPPPPPCDAEAAAAAAATASPPLTFLRSSPSRNNNNSSDWDFHSPFHPSEPPPHLRQQRLASAAITSTSDSTTTTTTTIPPHESPQEEDMGSEPEQERAPQQLQPGDDEAAETEAEEKQGKEEEGEEEEKSEGSIKIVAEEVRENDDDDDDGDDDGGMRLALYVTKTMKKKALSEIMKEVDDEFLKASSSAAQEVSRLLLDTTTRRTNSSAAAPSSSSSPSKYTSSYATRLLHSLSWNWSSLSSTARSKHVEPSNVDSTNSPSQQSSTLQRLLACERKLLEQVKVVESLRVQREKKCHVLRHQETRGEDAAEIEKTRADIKRLHSLILSSTQAVDSTVEAIEDLRDDDLHPQLVSLVEALMHMWETIHGCHARQTQIVIHLKNLDATMSHEPTSDAHHATTMELHKQLSDWHQSFQKLVGSQRAYMAALYEWLKLTRLPVLPNRVEKKVTADEEERGGLELFRLCEEWHRALSCLPDKVAGEAIKSLAEVVKGVVQKQAEEIKQRKKVEKMEKQWEKKARALKPLEEEEEEAAANRRRRQGTDEDDESDDDGKQKQQATTTRSMMMISMPPIGLMERRAAVCSLKKKLEAEMAKHCKAVQDTRVLTMNNLQTGLPGVLEAMTGFSAVFSQSFQHLHSLNDRF